MHMTAFLESALVVLAAVYGVSVPGMALFAALTLRRVDREERERLSHEGWPST